MPSTGFADTMGLFDPAAIIGLLGVHFFFLAPLLHVAWDSWVMPYVSPLRTGGTGWVAWRW